MESVTTESQARKAATERGERVRDNETPREKFVRIAELRTSKAILAIRTLRGLTGKNYAFNAEDWSTILGALNGELQQLRDQATTALNAPKEGGKTNKNGRIFKLGGSL